MQQMTFHVVSLPHTQTTKEYDWCAYTAKVRKFCIMMKSLGHKVYLYASEENEAPCDELITCITKEQQNKYFKTDYKKQYAEIVWDPTLPYWQIMNNNAIKEIAKRKKQKDFICLIGGNCQKPIDNAFPFPQNIVVEFGIGYEGVFSQFKVFESYAWLHHVAGMRNEKVGSFFDVVIPNYFDTKDFHLVEKPRGYNGKPYILYFGRLINNKGLSIAIEASKKSGIKLLLAGQGVKKYIKKRAKSGQIEHTLVTNDNTYVGTNFEYVGFANPKKRAELMGNALALMAPTIYYEPFGGVSIEAMLCGTPVITTDWGAFSENNIDGITGFRARTLSEFVEAIRKVSFLDRVKIYKYAVNNFSLERVGRLYQSYFQQLLTLWNDGWYSDVLPELENRGRYSRYISK